MKEIIRQHYLEQLISRERNGLIKVITGIRRCGKSYLLDPLFRTSLRENGVPDDHIIKIELDRIQNQKYHHDPAAFNDYLFSFIKDDAMHYFLLDEIQMVDDFELVLNGLLYEKNIDVYVTGSNSRFLSTDIITEFRGRSDQVRVHPLAFAEFLPASPGDRYEALQDYMTYGGMPLVLAQDTPEGKSAYLKDLFSQTYFRDIIERNHIHRTDILDDIVNILASSIGSLTNPQKIFDTFRSNGEKELSLNTINAYLSHLEDAFIIQKATRYDIKGRKYIRTPAKYYFTDLGLRNARLNFRQQERSHLMENMLYNELILRGYSVDVGVVEVQQMNDGKRYKGQYEIDFVVNLGNEKVYVQSALNVSSPDKKAQETFSLHNTGDFFRKIIVLDGNQKMWTDEDGVIYVGVIPFLLNDYIEGNG